MSFLFERESYIFKKKIISLNYTRFVSEGSGEPNVAYLIVTIAFLASISSKSLIFARHVHI